ncbi:unnamed protein product, partial [Didymodactylos carnosus]
GVLKQQSSTTALSEQHSTTRGNTRGNIRRNGRSNENVNERRSGCRSRERGSQSCDDRISNNICTAVAAKSISIEPI